MKKTIDTIDFKERRFDASSVLDELQIVGSDYELSLSEKLKIITTTLNNIDSANAELRSMLGSMYNSNHNDSVSMRLARNSEIKEQYLSDINEKVQSFVFREIVGIENSKEMDGDQFRKSYEEQRKILEECKFKQAPIPEILEEMDYDFGKMLLAKKVIFNSAWHEHDRPNVEDGYVYQILFDYAAYSQLTPEIAELSACRKWSQDEYEHANRLLGFLYKQERENNIDPTQKRLNGDFIVALLNDDFEKMESLVEKGADYRLNNDALISWVALRGELEAVGFFMEKNATVTSSLVEKYGTDNTKDFCKAYALKLKTERNVVENSNLNVRSPKLKM